MTREEAIEWLDGELDYYEACVRCHEEDGAGVEAYKMAIKALKQPEIIRCKDCIHSSGVKMVDGWTYCAEGRLLVKYEDGYCSDARRREE